MTLPGRPKVVITHWVHDEVLQLLGSMCDVLPNTNPETLPRDELLRRSADADAIMVFMPDLIDVSFLDQCPRLKVIAAALKGYDNIDVDACRRRGITFSFVPDLLTEPTAELAVALLLAIGRNILNGDRMVRSGSFSGWRPVLYSCGLWNSTVGIVGMGAIGQAIARRLKGFGCEVAYYDPCRLDQTCEQDLRVSFLPFDDLLKQSRFVLTAIPLSPESLHLFDRQTLALMPHGSILVNVGRGSVVDEAAVAEYLQEGHLAGYAADVFEFEDWARLDRPGNIHQGLINNNRQTVLTPHLGSATDIARREIALVAAKSILTSLQS
jgi:phosphonate dehydrogenase